MELLDRWLTPKMPLAQDRQLFNDRALSAMIVPLFIEQLLQMIVGIADTLMVSYAGEATVSGVSLDTMIYTIFIYLFTAAATGGAVVVSQYLGSRDRKNADLAASQLYMLSGVISLVCVLLVLLFENGLLQLLYPSVEPAVMEAARIYLRIVAISFPANALYNAGAALYRSMGRTRTTMLVTTAMNVINVIGNAIGIFVLRAGAAGVAWPTTIAWYFAAIVMTVLCFRSGSEVRLHTGLILRVRREMVRRILRVAVPNAVENSLFQLAKVVLGSLVATFGTAQIAANGIGQTIWSLAAVMSVTMSPVFITVIGQCMGKGDVEAADWYMHKLLRLTVLLCVVWNLFILAIVPLILPLYQVSDEAKRLVWIIVVIHNLFSMTAHPFFGPLSAGLKAAGDVRFAMWSSLFATVLCRTFLSFLLGLWMGMGVIGIALAMGLDWCIKGTLDILRWRSGKWKRFKVI